MLGADVIATSLLGVLGSEALIVDEGADLGVFS